MKRRTKKPDQFAALRPLGALLRACMWFLGGVQK